MSQGASLTAYEGVNSYDYHDLVQYFFQIWRRTINFPSKLLRKIEQHETIKPIETTTELAEIIKSAKPS